MVPRTPMMDRMPAITDNRTQSPPSYHLSSPPSSAGSTKVSLDYEIHQPYKSIQQHQGARARSRYGSVNVLLVQWAEDDLGVSSEVKRLEELLAGPFNFNTHLFSIPSINSEDKLLERLMLLRQGKGEGDLLIVYYAGHAGGSEGNCIWAANKFENSPEICWQNIQGLILGSPSDSLFILDCCASLLALSPHPGKGDNWLFGSSAKESVASGVRWNSFTSMMVRELERRANIYQERDERFSVLDIDHALSNHDRGDLLFSSVCKRLTEHDCFPTDLTPLPRFTGPNRVQTLHDTDTETSQHGTVSLPVRPRPYSQAVQPGNTASSLSHSQEPKNYFQGSTVPIELSIDDVQTIRLAGLPPLTHTSDIIQWFEERLGRRNVVSRIGPLYQAGSIANTITFSNAAIARRALLIQNCHFQKLAGGSTHQIAMDKELSGITCVYSSERSPNSGPDINILLIHGTGGHPINSFASHYIEPSKEVMWPRDELPRVLEAAGIFPRVVTLGWDADLWLTNPAHVQKASENLITALKDQTTAKPNRPFFVIAHGVGGVLAKMMVNSLINEGLFDKDFHNAVKCCFFFAVPHHKLDYRGFASILAGMRSIHPLRNVSNNGTQDFMASNTLISNISTEFDAIRKEHGIHTFSFFEKLPTKGNTIVPQACAVLDSSADKSAGIGMAHNDVAKLPGARANAELVIKIIHQTINNILHPATRPQKPNAERMLGMLKKYDTVFVVDDSDSMAGVRWSTAARVLAKIAAIAVKYDNNGVDIRFFNTGLEEDEGQNIKTEDKVMDLFRKVEPEGPTLTANVLEEELSSYMYEYGHNRRKKPLNLIILTDGEPETGQDVEGVIKEYATQLKEAKAGQFQVGIQFVQIGGDPEAGKFLESLDNDLQDRYGLDRDMVDTVPWVDGDEEQLTEKILLGGILKHYDKMSGGRESPP